MFFKPACQQAHLSPISFPCRQRRRRSERDHTKQRRNGVALDQAGPPLLRSSVVGPLPPSAPLATSRCSWGSANFPVRTSRHVEYGRKVADRQERSRLLPRNLSCKMTGGLAPLDNPRERPMQLLRHRLRRMFAPSRMRGAAIFVLFTTGWIVVAFSSVQTSPKREEGEAAPQTRQGPPAIPATLPAAREVLDKYLHRLP